MQFYHLTVCAFPVHFLVHNVILSKWDMCGFVVAVEAAGGFLFFGQSVQLAGQLGQLVAVLVPESPFHKIKNSEAVSSPRSTKQVLDKIVGSRK